jgi:hypothetical protein
MDGDVADSMLLHRSLTMGSTRGLNCVTLPRQSAARVRTS